MKPRLNILFPGAMKPAHTGHIYLIKNAAKNHPEYNTHVYVIVGKKPRDGVSMQSSIDFLKDVFSNTPNVHILKTESYSPIQDAYELTLLKEFGNGIYAMLSSAKGGDYVRSRDFFEKFTEGGAFYTEGVVPVEITDYQVPCIYTERTDELNGEPISASIIRNDILNRNYEAFLAAYAPVLSDGTVTESQLRDYYEILKGEVTPKRITESFLPNALNEGGAAGHMMHPYEVNEFTFDDIIRLIAELLCGSITDVTEKLDGQNLFASMDEHGNVIFARNETHMKYAPWSLKDLCENPKWVGEPSVQHAFTNGAYAIAEVFKNIPDAKNFFNVDDKLDGVRYRLWVNMEIMDPDNVNVIPYLDAKISVHGIRVVCFKYPDDVFAEEYPDAEITDDPNEEKDMAILEKAVRKTTNTAFKPQITPKVILAKTADMEKIISECTQDLREILEDYSLDLDCTIEDYKKAAIKTYLENRKEIYISEEAADFISDRWIGKSGYNLNTLKSMAGKNIYEFIRDFEKDGLKRLKKKIEAPLDHLFIKVGNTVIRNAKGFVNDRNASAVKNKLKKELADLIDEISKTGSEEEQDKMERMLIRLESVNSELNATEGIVFKYGGRLLKLTGSFAPLNALLGMQKYKKC